MAAGIHRGNEKAKQVEGEHTMKSLIVWLSLVVMVMAVPALALDDSNNYLFKGKLEMDKGGVLEVGKGTLKIDGTTVSATAAQLNAAAAGTAPLASGKIFVGSVSGVATAVTPSGDATVTTGGVVSLAARSVAGAELPIAEVGQILVGQADSNATVQTVSGAITIAANGVTTIAPTTTVTRLLTTTARVNGRTPVQSYSATSNLVLDMFAGCTNGQVVTFSNGAYAARPSVVASYSTTSTAQGATTNCEIHSITLSNCVVVCEAGKTVDLVLVGVRD